MFENAIRSCKGRPIRSPYVSQSVSAKLTKTLSIAVCLLHLFIPIAVISHERSSESSRKQKQQSPVVDALWINIIPSRMNFPPGKYPKASYFDVQSDGRFVFAEGDDPAMIEIVRAGNLSKEFVRRAFQIVDKPSVLNARDTDPGEPIFSDSDWVNVGLSMSGKVKATGGWAFGEEIKDFPEEFRKLLAELKSTAAKLPRATNIKALLSASRVEAKRVELVGRERFLVLDEVDLDRFPALKQAILTSRRLVAVEDETQMSRLSELAKRMDPKATYWGLYAIEGRGFYEIGAHYLPRAR